MSDSSSVPSETPAGKTRGQGRGGKFFVLDRSHWERLWTVKTANRLNLVTAFLVLLAGTGADHRLTKWSAKACEQWVGMGKPRARTAIEELIGAELAERTEASRPLFPQYRLAAHESPDEPIFLPIQLVTGLSAETPVLRRVRETGDPLVLRMLIDLHGLVQIDATHAVPLAKLRLYDDAPDACRKVTEAGANGLWAVHLGSTRGASGDWCEMHAVRKAGKADWANFWERIGILQRIGAVWFEPWIFDGDALDAEPLFPVSSADNSAATVSDDVGNLTQLMMRAAESLVGERAYLLDQNADRNFVVLPGHHRPPAIRGVAKLRVEADTPGRRLSYAKRKDAIESATSAYEQLIEDINGGRFNRPLRPREETRL